MARLWDDALKRVFANRPQDFVHWLLPGALFVTTVSLELKTLTRTVTADTLYKVSFKDQEALLHIEFQKYADKKMATRLWEYNVLATLKHNCPVYSFVIYLKAGGHVPESPLVWELAGHEAVHVFHFWNVKLWELPVNTLWEADLPGVLPLCLLAQGGQQHRVAEEVFASLQDEKELLALAFMFASMVFEGDIDKPWLERKVAMLDSILRETWFYQKIWSEGQAEGVEKGRAEGVEKGRAEGVEKGVEKGKADGIRLVILDTIHELFPEMSDLAQTQLEPLQDAEMLRHLNTRLVAAKSAEEVKRCLLDISKNT